jgi:DNA-binding YbaB/EbfC family protein
MNLASLMKQAKQMQKKMNAATKEFEAKTFEFKHQQNLIQGTMKGDLTIVDLKIDESLLTADNKDVLSDMLMITINEITKKVVKEKEDTLNKISNGVDVSMFM